MSTTLTRMTLVIAAVLSITALLATTAHAQTGAPSLPKTITMVVPFAAGGSTDLLGRQIALRLTTRTGINVVVDNRAGAGGMIGSEYVSRAPGDGSVILFNASDYSVGAATRKRLPFDPVKDLTAAAIVGTGPMLLVVNAGSPYKTTEQLLDAARKNKGQLNYGSAGVGSLHHLAMELLNAMAGTEITHVPYKGSAPAVLDLMSDRIQVMVGSIPATQSHIKGGKLTALAVTSASPSRFTPDLPTVAAVVPGYDVEVWWGVFVPGTMPKALVDRLNAELRAVVTQPDMQEYFEKDGVQARVLPPTESAAFVRADIEKWREVARRHNIVVE